MKRILLVTVLTIAAPFLVNAQELKPLSVEDKAQVEALLKDFDPNSYQIQYQYTDSKGTLKTTTKGLANLRQRATIKPGVGAAASTNTTNNVFKASTNTTNNVFKASTNTTNNVFKASTNTTNNVFKASTGGNLIMLKQGAFEDAASQSKIKQLNTILQKYQ
jgi:hypothetical protein